MTPCPHFTPADKLMHCALTPGLIYPGPEWPNCPCVTCRDEWPGDQPPTAKTPTLVKLTEAFGSTPAPWSATVDPSKGVRAPGSWVFRWWWKPLAILYAVARWAFFGFPITSEAIYYSRRAVCGKCEYWTGRGCRVCGCTGVKLRIETERCPLGKW